MLLALDTSTRTIGIALYDSEELLAETVWRSHNYHTRELAPAVQDLMAKSDVTIDQLQAAAVALGPGSFTGLRIGLAFAKGLALVRRIPLIGIPTLDIVAQAQPVVDFPLVSVLRAGRGRLAVGWYSAQRGAWQAEGDVSVLTTEELFERIDALTMVAGELTEDERRLLNRKRKLIRLASPAASLRRPGFLAELAWRRWQSGSTDDPATLAPIYLHHSNPVPD
ncbi:MAG TPA: tRNA (adenosine(37)-N6)-threonylcarbamoyltransferase complex dimerization subunit type 1 TsaB [Anaerolineales bacterium]|nr:tRNA (adenosine(37)-N6)-threonylcarbamoyltransferase complex dimerization subunit type 1 TsaB [Anaerolineales bacterium]